jgi:hypothetical protein
VGTDRSDPPCPPAEARHVVVMSTTSTESDLLKSLTRHLHGEILKRVASRDHIMTWQDFAKVSGLYWNRQKHWRLKEDALNWSPSTYIKVAGRLGIDVQFTVTTTPTKTAAGTLEISAGSATER